MPIPPAGGVENSFAPQMIFLGLRPGGWANNFGPFLSKLTVVTVATNLKSDGEAEMILNFSFADFYLSKVNSATSSLPAQPHIVTFEF